MKKAFTLIELLVVLSLFVIVLGSLLTYVKTHIALQQKVTTLSQETQLIDQVIMRISQDVRPAHAIAPTSTTTQLFLVHGDEIIEYSLANKKVKRKKNKSTAYLTDAGEIVKLIFSYPQEKTVEIIINNTKTRLSCRGQIL